MRKVYPFVIADSRALVSKPFEIWERAGVAGPSVSLVAISAGPNVLAVVLVDTHRVGPPALGGRKPILVPSWYLGTDPC